MGNKIILQVKSRTFCLQIATQHSHIRDYRGPRDTTFWGVHPYVEMCLQNFPCKFVCNPHTYVRRPLLRGANNELSKKKVKDELSSYALMLFSSIGSVLKTFSNQVHEIIRSIV